MTISPTTTKRPPLPPELERRALALVDELVEADDAAIVDRTLATEDAAVRRRVRRLLGRARTGGDLPTVVLADDEVAVPERVGVFALVEEIGAGGMGRVWRGERADGLFEQTVAVKLLRVSPALLGARFAEERRILARLDHPGIVRLIDGGVADGVSYLVMDHVRARHIDVAAAGLPLGERVALLREAAVAVQFAHARLVVHADLKPSNIVVDEGGRVRLLDFGVARLIGPEHLRERGDGAHPMTPAYASPARRAGRAPTIADDVFALGRLLAALTADARDPDRRQRSPGARPPRTSGGATPRSANSSPTSTAGATGCRCPRARRPSAITPSGSSPATGSASPPPRSRSRCSRRPRSGRCSRRGRRAASARSPSAASTRSARCRGSC